MSGDHQAVDLVDGQTVEYLARAVLIAALLAAMAKFRVPYPLSPTDVTLQVMGVFLAGLLLGPLWGGFSVALYLVVGLAGAPVFTDGGGPGYVWHQTAGFLLGFLLAAVVIGAIVHRGIEPRDLSEVPTTLQVGALCVGLVVIYAAGVPWLASVMGLTLAEAAVTGALVFVPADLLKLAATLALVRRGDLAAT